MSYGAAHAELYDPVFRSRGKDFAGEAEGLNRLVRSRFPGARTLLDVACGTGAHLEHLAGYFDHVEGLDHSPAMREVARGRLPGVAVHGGDMRDFELHRTFDVVICMGSGLAEADSPGRWPTRSPGCRRTSRRAGSSSSNRGTSPTTSSTGTPPGTCSGTTGGWSRG
ncbi:class I SAM-dependent methyltransferase [Actinomadura luteofluorescens]|uniref:class I SAM-dependent methyltransferase n=1 Tax=Actinomadura luteofluorescens TaxID=46163 RepID=UPI00363B24D6